MLTIRVHLNDSIREDPLYNDNNGKGLSGYFGNYMLSSPYDQLHIDLKEYDLPALKIFYAYTKIYTIIDSFVSKVNRTAGMYKLGTAKAFLENKMVKDGSCWLKHSIDIKISGKVAKDVLNLYYQIRAGKILPTESWEDEQITKDQILKERKEKFQQLNFFQKAKQFLDNLYGKLTRE